MRRPRYRAAWPWPPEPSPGLAGMDGGHFLFASESVTEGHPDKLCDRVSDAVLDACLAQDPDVRSSCEACTKTGMVMVLGEVVTKASINYEHVIREAVKAVGYDSDEKGLDWRTMNVIVAVEEQSPDLAQAITIGRAAEEICPEEIGIAFGYATDETPEMMPLSHVLASKLCARLDAVRKDGVLPWARPSGSAQVVVEYAEDADGAVVPLRVHSVAISVQHALDVAAQQVESELMQHVVMPVIPEQLRDSNTMYNFKSAGPRSDTGLSGHKAAVDGYGGWGGHEGSSASGKDGTKVSRCALYGARWAACSLVAARFCRRCLVQLSYTPGSAQPMSIQVQSYGTARARGKTDVELVGILSRNFDFRPGCLQRDLGMKALQFQQLSAHGHFGRTDMDLPWEKPQDLK